jgi:hypothetical protein
MQPELEALVMAKFGPPQLIPLPECVLAKAVKLQSK